jgi:hypothetical protein
LSEAAAAERMDARLCDRDGRDHKKKGHAGNGAMTLGEHGA